MHSIASKISLWVYVFALLAAFLLVLAMVQLIFLNHIEAKINQDISTKTTFLTNRAIEIAVEEQINDINALVEIHNNQTDTQETEASSTKQIDKVSEITVMYKNGKQTIDVSGDDIPAELIESIRSQLQSSNADANEDEHFFMDGEKAKTSRLEEIHNKLSQVKIEPKDNNVFVFSSTKSMSSSPLMVFETDQTTVSEYFRYLNFGTIGSASLSLIFALWLAKHVTKPLARLSLGFRKLSEGELGFTLNAEGVKEVEQTLELFNQTSTRLKLLQEQEHRFRQRLQLAELGEISRGMAHSLRNPLNTIGLALEQIAQPDIDNKERRILAEHARVKIQALDKTIRSLLLLTTSGIDRNQTISLNNLLEDISMQAGIDNNCKIEVFAEQKVNVQGSEPELSAVLASLISNAQEASSKSYRIEIRLACTETDAIISIIDQGSGLHENIISHLFKPHVSTKAEGAGMGLYIAKRILTLHYSGNLTLKNNYATGCTATIRLPLKRHENQSDIDQDV